MKKKTIGNCLLYHGDCFDILPKLDIVADAVISDPPFGITACHWDVSFSLADFWEKIQGKTKPTANFVLFGCGKFSVDLINSNYRWFRYDLIWAKNNKVGFLNANLMPMRNHESILVFGKPGFVKSATYNPQKTPDGHVRRQTADNRRQQRKCSIYSTPAHDAGDSDGTLLPCSVMPFKSEKDKGLHPTLKPVALMEYLVKTYTNEGDIVIDPFMGSGTTGVACAMHGRRFIGIEKEKQYFDIAAERIRNSLRSP
jgi:site-specific DNA-methyltransferase (adenine-specific)